MKLSEVTRPVRSKAPDLRLSVHKATVSRRRRAESGQGQPRNKTTKMETRGLWERTVVSWTGANGVSRGGGTRLQPPPAPPAGSWLPFPVCKQQRRPGRGQRSLPALPFYLPGFLVLKPQAGIAAMPSVWQVRVCSLNTASKVPWAPTPGHPARQGRTEVRAANTDVFFWMKGDPPSLPGRQAGPRQGLWVPFKTLQAPRMCSWNEPLMQDREQNRPRP